MASPDIPALVRELGQTFLLPHLREFEAQIHAQVAGLASSIIQAMVPQIKTIVMEAASAHTSQRQQGMIRTSPGCSSLGLIHRYHYRYC